MLKLLLALAGVFVLSSFAYCAHPLNTDDTDTQGKGKVQLELNGGYVFDKDTLDNVTTKVRNKELAFTMSVGILDNVDVVASIPYAWNKSTDYDFVTADSSVTKNNGLSDATLNVKWRFFESEDGFSLAIRPGVIIPTGKAQKDLGNGKVSYSTVLIATKKLSALAIHADLGYTRNEYKLTAHKEANRNDIWNASLALEFKAIAHLKPVVEIEIKRNQSKISNNHPVSVTGGLIYSLFDNLDLDIGTRAGLNKSANDYAVLAGIVFRF